MTPLRSSQLPPRFFNEVDQIIEKLRGARAIYHAMIATPLAITILFWIMSGYNR
jgi:hypothetical protein